MVKWFKFLGLSAMLVSASYSSASFAHHGQSNPEAELTYPVMAVPLQPELRFEMQIAKLNKILFQQDLTEEDKAKIYYERGRLYGNIGLHDLARLDFNQSLKISPAQPKIFNRLGVYFTQVGEFDAAFNAFSAAIELAPEDSTPKRNKAVALYYAGRLDLALEDMKAHFNEDKSDPFRALWLFFVECAVDEKSALDNLEIAYKNKTEDWNWTLVGIALGKIDQQSAINEIIRDTTNNRVMAQKLTEVYFYTAKYLKSKGKISDAMALYKLAISLNVYNYVEHGYSFLELGRIFQEYKAAQKNGDTKEYVKN